jgi:hypothetical protein
VQQLLRTVTEKVPWIALVVFSALCFVGALIPIGYTGYVIYGILIWLVVAIPLRRLAKPTTQTGSVNSSN